MQIQFNDLSRENFSWNLVGESMKSILDSGIYLGGPFTLNLQKQLQEYLGTSFVHLVSDGTSALTLAFKALKLKFEVKTILMTPNAGGYGRVAANAAGLHVKYIDCDEQGQFSIERLKDHSESYDAVLVTHLYGKLNSNIADISDYLVGQGKYLIEDVAQAFGARYNNHAAGYWGDISTYSFYPTKNLGAAGDAGAVSTRWVDLYDLLKSLSQYGWGAKYQIELTDGENSRIDEIQAMLLGQSLKYVDQRNSKRRNIWCAYKKAIAFDSNLKLLGSEDETFVGHLAVLDVGERRAEIRYLLESKGISTSIHYPHLDYKNLPFIENWSCPNAEKLVRGILSIPLYPGLAPTEIDFICNALSEL